MKLILILFSSLLLCGCRGTLVVQDPYPPPPVVYVEPLPPPPPPRVVIVRRYWCPGCCAYVHEHHRHPGFIVIVR